MDDFKLEERLMRIEQLLAANKEVLTLEEACGIQEFPRATCTSSPPPEKYRIPNQWGRQSISRGRNLIPGY